MTTSLRGFARLHKIVAYVLAWLGLACVALGTELSGFVTLALLLLSISTWWLEGPRIERFRPLVTVVVIVHFVLALTRYAFGASGLALAIEVSYVLQCSRLALRTTAAIHRQIALIALVHLAAGTVVSTEVAYAVVFLAVLLVLPWMLALNHLRFEIELAHPPPSTAAPGDRETLPPHVRDGENGLARVLASNTLVGPSFLGGIAALTLPVFLLTGIVFLLFPRVGSGMLSFGGARRSVSGFSSEVELGEVGRIDLDQAVVLRVRRADSGPPLHLRGTTFDHYDGRRWRRSETRGGRGLVALEQREFPLTRQRVEGRDRAIEIDLEALADPVVFLPVGTISLVVPPALVQGLPRTRAILAYPAGEYRYDGDAIGLRYTAWVADRIPPEPLAAAEREAYLQVPPGHERLRELAEAWTVGLAQPHERAAALEARLRSAPFRYSTELRDPGTTPPIVAFLFDWREGHCEYSSSSMVLLARSLGLPAREVTGFAGGVRNDVGGYEVIRASDAHAWAEVYIDGVGWETFDPTPPAGEPEALGTWTALLDSLASAWREGIVEYDLGAQGAMLRRLFQQLRRTRAPSSEARAATSTSRSPSTRVALGVGAALALVTSFVLWRRRRTEPPRPELRALRRIASRFERYLARVARPRLATHTWKQHSTRLPADEASLARDLARLEDEARYGGHAPSESVLTTLRARLDQLESR